MPGRWPQAPPALAVSLAVGIVAVLPLLWRGPSCGQDFDFHLQSWLAVHAAWHAGLLSPHWVPGANYGAGEPRFVFYPPLSWLLGAALGLLLPWAWVPAAFTGVCFAGAAAAMQRAARDWCPPGGAALAGVLYALNPYLLFTGYERAAYAELLAAVWMPLLLAALPAPRLRVSSVAALVAALWFTNAPAGVMGCYLVLLAMLWRAGCARRLAESGRELARGAGAFTLGCGLAGVYLLPAWYEQRFVSIARAVGPGMRVEDSFLFGRTGEPYHDQVLRTASWIVVWTVAAGLAAGAAVLARRARRNPAAPAGLVVVHRRGAVAFLFVLVVVCALLQLRWSEWLWRLLPEFAFLQFPWRLMLPASAAVALLWGLAAGRPGGDSSASEVQVGQRKRDRFAQAETALARSGLPVGLAVAGMVYAAGLVAWAAQTRWQPCDEEDNVQAQVALLRSGAGFEGTDEYAAAGSDNGEIQRGLPLVRLLGRPDAEEGDDSGPGVAPQWRPRAQPGTVQVEPSGPERLAVRVFPEANGFAVLRLERSPAWRVLLNGAPCGAACVLREDGLVTVRVPGQRWSTIEARYATTPDVWLGRAISCASVLIWLGWLVWVRRRNAEAQTGCRDKARAASPAAGAG